MIHALSQRFHFDAAHTLQRDIDGPASRRIHGHTYHAEVTVQGPRDAATGMVVDLGLLRAHIEHVRLLLDHAYLDDVEDLGQPTLENLCEYIARRFAGFRPPVSSVRVWREASGDGCLLRL